MSAVTVGLSLLSLFTIIVYLLSFVIVTILLTEQNYFIKIYTEADIEKENIVPFVD